jgi:hypothetical protein
MDRATLSRFVRISRCLAGAVALASLALACGDESKPTEPAAAPTDAEQAASAPGEAAAPAAAVPGAPEGDAVAQEGVLPEGYPSDVPVYPGATPGSSMAMPGLGVFATFQSSDGIEQILGFYRDGMTKGGWSVQDTADKMGLDATKESRSVQVRVRPGDSGRTEIAVNTSEK